MQGDMVRTALQGSGAAQAAEHQHQDRAKAHSYSQHAEGKVVLLSSS